MATSKKKSKMSLLIWVIYIFISITFDLFDFFFGWVPGFGSVLDFIGFVLAYVMWGPAGLIAVWELIAVGPGNVADAFVPTLTLIGVYIMASGQVDTNIKKKRKKNGKRKRKK